MVINLRSANLTDILSDYRPPRDLLAGRVILVTGAGAGIGRAAALAFSAHGASVILLGRTVQKLEAVYDEIEKQNAPAPAIVPVDLALATWKDYAQLADRIGQEFGRLDGLLHNAALFGTLTPLALYDLEQWSDVMRVNLHAPYLLTRACLPLLEKSPDASVIFTSTDVARKGRAYWGAYAVTGFAREGLMQVWADELETNTHIRMNSLDPGPVRTQMRAAAYPGEDPRTLPEPEAIMSMYLYLMGPDSRQVRGQTLSVAPAPRTGTTTHTPSTPTHTA